MRSNFGFPGRACSAIMPTSSASRSSKFSRSCSLTLSTSPCGTSAANVSVSVHWLRRDSERGVWNVLLCSEMCDSCENRFLPIPETELEEGNGDSGERAESSSGAALFGVFRLA